MFYIEYFLLFAFCLSRQQVVDPSTLEFCSDSGTEAEAFVGCSLVSDNDDSNGQQQNNIACTPIYGSCAAEFTFTSEAIVPFGESTSGEGLDGKELSREEMNQTSESGDAAGSDWDTFDVDLLILSSPLDVDVAKGSQDPSTDCYGRTCDMQSIQNLGPPVPPPPPVPVPPVPVPVQQGNRNELDNPFTQGMLAGPPSQENGIEGGSLDDKTYEEVTSFIPKSYLLCITLKFLVVIGIIYMFFSACSSFASQHEKEMSCF